MARHGQINVTTASARALPKRDGRKGVILNHISGGEVTFAWGNGITVTASTGGIINSTKSGIVLDDGSPMYEEELHMIADEATVIAFHEIGPVS